MFDCLLTSRLCTASPTPSTALVTRSGDPLPLILCVAMRPTGASAVLAGQK